MFNLRFLIYFICFFIFLHFSLYFFNIDMFELFESKKYVNDNNEVSNEIDDSISELEKSIQELKDVSAI